MPVGVVVDTSGNVLIADYINSRIRQVGTNGIITTIAGNGNSSFSGDGGPATNAALYYPGGIAVDASGNLFIADSENDRIRMVLNHNLPSAPINLLGQTNSVLTMASVTTTNAGYYYVVVTNPYCSVTSSSTLLTLLLEPNIYGCTMAGNGNFIINLASSPSSTNRLWGSTNLVNWQVLATNIAGANGLFQFQDINAQGSKTKYYLLSLP